MRPNHEGGTEKKGPDTVSTTLSYIYFNNKSKLKTRSDYAINLLRSVANLIKHFTIVNYDDTRVVLTTNVPILRL